MLLCCSSFFFPPFSARLSSTLSGIIHVSEFTNALWPQSSELELRRGPEAKLLKVFA